MANEFIIKNGFHSKGDSEITGSLEVSGSNTNFILNSTDSKFTDSRTTTKGIEYNADYSSNFTSRSLVDRNYVDTNITTNITASVGAGLTYNTSSGKIDLGGVLNFNDPNNAANNIYFTPTLGANLVTWGLNSDNDVATNSAQNQVHYITYFRNWSSLGTFNVTGYYGEGAYGNGVSGNSLGCYEHQGRTFHIKEYKDVSQFSNSDGSINSYGGTSSKRTFSQYDDNNSHILQIWESDSTVGTPRNSKFTNTFSKFEWLIDNTAGHTSTFRFTEGGINISIPNADNSKSLTAILQPNAIYLKDGEGLGITTLPTGLLLGDMGAFKGLFIGKGVNDSYYDDNTTNKKGIKYVGFGETNADTAAGANYNTLVGTSLVPKKYLEDYVAASGSADTIYTADGALTGDRTVDLDGNSFEFTSSAAHNTTPINFEFGEYWQGFTRWDNTGAVKIKSNGSTDPLRVYKKVDSTNPNFVSRHVGGGHLGTDGNAWTVSQTYGSTTATRMELNHDGIKQYHGSGLQHSNIMGGAGSGVKFWVGGFSSLGDFIVGGSALISTEDISLQGDTLISKKLELSTTTDGMLMPRLTTAQMNAISSPDTHLLIFNTDLNALYRYNGSAWVAMAAGYGVISINDSSGIPTYYATLPAAFTAASNGGVITLHSDITITSQCTMPGAANATLTINGNGYTITHTSNTGSEFSLIHTGSGVNKILYLNDVKVVSNGTATGASTSSIFAPQLGSGGMSIKANSGTFISSINNPCVYIIPITGGNWTSTNSYVNFSGDTIDAKVIVKSGRGNFINCDITIVSGGQIGLNGNLINCTITGDAISQDMITTNLIQKIHGCTITCTSGANSAIVYNGGVTWTTSNPTPIKDTKVYYYGTDPYAVKATYIASIKDVYIYSDTTTCLYAQSTTQTGGYNLENVVLETNSTNKAAFYRLDSGIAFRMKNVSATNWNSTNTEEAFDIRVSGANELYMENCSANVANPSVDNIKLNNSSITTGGAYIYGLTMGKIGTGLNLNTVPLLNSNTADEFGNIKIG